MQPRKIEFPRARRPAIQIGRCNRLRLGKGAKGTLDFPRLHRKGLETGKMHRARRAHLGPEQRGCQHVQTRAKPQFGNVKPVLQTCAQIIAVQKHMPRFRQPVVQREIRIVELTRYGDNLIPPVQICVLVVRHLMS